MTVIPLDTIANPKHRNILRYISDVFDENHGNITDHVALTKFNSNNHTILFNTESPDLNGKTLIPFDNDRLLFAPINISSVICSDTKNNSTINTLTQKNNNTWEAVSDEGKIGLFLRIDKSPVAGFSIKFADAVRTKYRVSIDLGNEQGEVLSSMEGMDSSWDTNNHQFFQFSSPVEGVVKAKIMIELVGTNADFVWKINNISFYSNMNGDAMKSLNESGIITWTMINNPTVRKGMDEEPVTTGENDIPTKAAMQVEPIPNPEFDVDHYGSPLPYAPDMSRQFFDNLSSEEITRISNLPRLYTTTNLPTGDKIYTFQTKESDRTLTLKFLPQTEMDKYPDETVTDINVLQERGYMKKGGFKNYILTMYIKLDKVQQTNQILLWKYGGFFFSKANPQLARAMNVIIPVNNKTNELPHVYTEYSFEHFNDITGKMTIIDGSFKGLEEGKWIGIQFIRQVDSQNNRSKQVVRINKNPMDENGILRNPNEFKTFISLRDEAFENHTPHVWGGVNEIISVVGAEFVNLYGVSLYETVEGPIEW